MNKQKNKHSDEESNQQIVAEFFNLGHRKGCVTVADFLLLHNQFINQRNKKNVN